VMIIGDKALNSEYPTPVFAHLFGNKMTYQSPTVQSWQIIYDEDNSWTRDCFDLTVKRLMNRFGEIEGYEINCDGDNEKLRRHVRLPGGW